MWVKTWAVFLGVLLATASFGLRAESGLNGMAIYSELGNELFIAALYSEQTGTNAQELINGAYPKRIELKILANAGVTERQFSRMWRESVAINNDHNLLSSQADNMLYFEDLIRARLEANDHLVIALVPTEGVFVSLNSVELGHIEDDAFFSLLLRSWIGPVPSSTRFRDDLLSVTQVDLGLVNRFDHMYPRNARIEVAKQWAQAAEPPAEDVQPQEPEILPVVASVIEPKQKPLPQAPRKLVASTVAVAKPIETIQPAVAIKPAAAPAEEKKSEASSQELGRAQAMLAKQFYMADVFKKIYSNVNYPKRAQELQQAGTVRLAVVIDVLGKLKTVAPVEKSPFTLLNKAALEAVKRAAPFSPLPTGIDVTELELSVPITFSLGGI